MLKTLLFPRLAACWLICGLLGLTQRPAAAQSVAARSYPEHRFGFRCAFDSVQQQAFERQPGSAAAYRTFLSQVASMSSAQRAQLQAAPDVTVPIVVHVIHTGGASNVSDQQVLDAVRVINLDFSKTNPDTADVIPAFRPLYANVGFRFRLAKIDPNGNCTTGITRTYSTDTNIGDDRVKSLIVWDQDRYLNIWVTTNANGAGGYAYLPCTGGTGDGIVIRSAQFGSIGVSGGSNLAVRSLTHEIGHFFGLPHTWGGTNTPGLATNCGIDDGVADTPNTTGIQGGCNLAFAPCTDSRGLPILANVQNYMDYSSCTRMFTLGQRAVMRSALQLSCRAQLTTPANLLATGTNDGYLPPAGGCAPVVAFRSNSTIVCEGSAITFTDYSYNADLSQPGTTYSWQFPGGVPATSNQPNPTVTYPAGGLYDVTLTISTPGGSSTRTERQLVSVIGAGSGLQAPLAESFENPGFPNNFNAPDLRNWTSSSTSSSGVARWQRLTSSPLPHGLVVPDGNACVTVRSSLIANGTITYLTSPNINLSSFTAANPPVIVFDRAYARRSGANDQLQVQFSTDCGVSWNTEANYFVTTLNTYGPNLLNSFVPDSLPYWQPLRVPVDPSYLGSRFQMRLALTSRGGNALYVDNVRIGLASATQAGQGAPAGAQLYPNPLTSETALYLTLAEAAPVQVQVLDLLGRVVLRPAAERTYPAGPLRLPVATPGSLAPGVYLVSVRTGRVQQQLRLLVP